VKDKDVEDIRSDFPFFEERHSGKEFIYFDSACMALKPVQVIRAMQDYYYQYPGCAGRSAHRVAERVELGIEEARRRVGDFIGARDEEIVFTRNTTEGINLLVRSLGLKKGDEVIISDKEHNSNLVPWLYARESQGIKVSVVRTNKDNTFNLEGLQEIISDRTKFASFVYTSNMDGVSNPVKDISKICHENGVRVHFDAAQAVPHKPVSVKEVGGGFFDFFGSQDDGSVRNRGFMGEY